LARFWPPIHAVTATNVSAVDPSFNDKMAGHRRPRPSSSVTDDGAEANRRVKGRFSLEDVQELAAAVAVAMAPMREEEVKAVCEAVRDQVSTEADRLVQDDQVLLGFAALVKAELVAQEQRADKTQDIAAAMAVIVMTAMVEEMQHSSTPGVAFEQRSVDEIRVAVNRALSMPQIRRAHALGVTRRVKLLDADEDAKGDTLTSFFLTAAKSSSGNNFVVKNFTRVNMGILNKIYSDYATIGNQPEVFRNKNKLVPSSLDRIDEAGLSIIRNALNDGRSVAREVVYKNLAYFPMQQRDGVHIKLRDEAALKPALGDAAGSAYFACISRHLASATGSISTVSGAAGPASERWVVREVCLYSLAEDVLSALVRHAHEFEPNVKFITAECLRRVVISPREVWSGADVPALQAAATNGPCVWSLLVPRPTKRLALNVSIQTMTAEEVAASPAAQADVNGAGGGVGNGDVDVDAVGNQGLEEEDVF